jgi:hypothetical protein
LIALLVCGVLDIAWAIGLTLLQQGDAGDTLRAVASGPFGSGVGAWGRLGAVAGLAVHFTIMAVMVAVYAALLRLPALRRAPWPVLGLVYGAALYVVMYRIVLPLRWPTLHPLHGTSDIVLTLLPHLFCVGLPMAFVFRPRDQAPPPKYDQADDDYYANDRFPYDPYR